MHYKAKSSKNGIIINFHIVVTNTEDTFKVFDLFSMISYIPNFYTSLLSCYMIEGYLMYQLTSERVPVLHVWKVFCFLQKYPLSFSFLQRFLVDKLCKHRSLSCSKYCESIMIGMYDIWQELVFEQFRIGFELGYFWMCLFLYIYTSMHGDVLDLEEAAVCKKN